MAARTPTTLDRQAFGRNLERLLSAAIETDGITARSFAIDIGVGEEKVSKWRKGRLAIPKLSTIIKIAVRFNVSLDTLLEGVDSDYEKFRRSAGSAHEKKFESPTPSGADLGVEELFRARSPYAESHAEDSHAEAAAVRPPLTIAADIQKQAADLHRQADALDRLAAEVAIARGLVVRPQKRTRRVPTHRTGSPKLPHRTTRKRG